MGTVLCGSIARHAGTLGQHLHRAGYAALGLDHAYVSFGVEDLAGAITGMRALGLRGLGVSMPYKEAVLPLLDALDPLARRIGAVNTIVNDDGRLTGHNTDALGASRALAEVIDVAGRRVLLLGSGGAARAIAHALSDAGARLHVAGRTLPRAEALAAAVGASAGPLATVDPAEHEVVINATSAGMAEVTATPALDPARLGPDHLLMDIVFRPLETALVAGARALGARVITGDRMLLHQACGQFELYTGHPAPIDAMAAALAARL